MIRPNEEVLNDLVVSQWSALENGAESQLSVVQRNTVDVQ